MVPAWEIGEKSVVPAVTNTEQRGRAIGDGEVPSRTPRTLPDVPHPFEGHEADLPTQRRRLMTLAVAHEGDTDATASLVGAVLGVTGGSRCLPADWIAALELREEIVTLADDLFRAPSEGNIGVEWWDRYPGC